MTERKIAFFVSSWASDPAIFSWVWLKQNFLRKTTPDGNNPNGFVLSESDILYVVHINKGSDDDDGWSGGGPVQPDLSLALAKYPHKTVVLDAGGVSLQSVMVEWIDRNNPDILVFGIREKGKPHKVVEYLRQHSTVPFLVVQPENVRNDRLRLTSDRDASERHRSTHADAASAATRGDGKGLQLATSPPALATVAEDDEDGDDAAVDDDEDDGLLFPVDGTSTPAARLLEGHTRPRKIAIAYEHDATGQLLLSFAARVVLQPHDSVLLVHCTANKRGDHHAQSSTAHGGGLAGSLQQPSQEGNVGSLSAKSLASSGKGDDLHAGDSFSSKHHDGASVSSRSLPSGDLAGREPSGCMPRSGGVAGALERIATRRSRRGDDAATQPSTTSTSAPTHDPAFADELLQGFTVVHSVRLRGDPRHMLCRFAAQMGIDLLIMGSSGRSMLKRALTGIQSAKALKVFTAISPAHSSVSRYVISHAPCPVLLVPLGKVGNSPTGGQAGGISTPVAGEGEEEGIGVVHAGAVGNGTAQDGRTQPVDPRLLPQRPHSVGSTPLGMSPPGTSPRWQATSGHAQLMSRNELVQLVESQDRQLQEKEQQIAALRAQLLKGGIGAT